MRLTKFLKAEWLQLLILIAPFVMLGLVWDRLPERIATHWDLHGNVNGYTSKGFGLFLLPIINIGLALLLGFLPRLDPKAAKMNLGPEVMKRFRIVITAFLVVIFAFILLAPLGIPLDIGVGIRFAVIGLFLVIGNYMPKLKPNYFAGIRLPWTLEDPENWRRTHLFAGHLYVGASLLTLLLEVTLPQGARDVLLIIYIGVLVIVPIAYSFLLWKKSTSAIT